MIKIYNYNEINQDEIIRRSKTDIDVGSIVSDIISDVRSRGDKALFDYTERFDKVKLKALEVTQSEIDNAFSLCSDELINALKEAKHNIIEYHKNQLKDGFCVRKENGAVLGQKVLPLKSVGIYVPGGTASYPSSVLMNAIPAKLAGVPEIIMVTPPSKDGGIKPSVLCAARIAGVDRIFKIGGAQAVAALTFGTESVPKVFKIIGPGNIFVSEAKRQVFGQVDIDMIAGPSEILIIADEGSNPAYVAADMLSQAEHDKLASSVLVTTSKNLAQEVSNELERQLPILDRSEIARESIENYGKIIIVSSIEEAIEVANELAPEHLEICVDKPFDYLDKIENAASVFLGNNTPEALGDYFAGTNHTLPTGGTAKFSSPLSVDDFIKKIQYTYYTHDALHAVSDKIALLAFEEGLGAHAKSTLIRFENE
ncbi:MAG TPA: histidinol dehydrogenase [Clostridiales bacterium]|nr:histidinol dehydrogenase [Clostridiales bacterium]